jgi:hypothetical protein
MAGIAAAQFWRAAPEVMPAGPPQAEFHMGRLAYYSRGCAGSRGSCNPFWAIDYPLAEQHFLPALERMTRIDAADDSQFLTLDDDALFDYPWILLQQPGQGYWHPEGAELARIREYLLRGGLLVVDDFHGWSEWRAFEEAILAVLPDRRIVEIPDDDMLISILFDLDKRTSIPGERHLYSGMQGPSQWRGIYDDDGRLMVAINFNIDLGDAWEHADDPGYPAPMTTLAYKFGVNYVVYAMTH